MVVSNMIQINEQYIPYYTEAIIFFTPFFIGWFWINK